jgi:hypothetical protein
LCSLKFINFLVSPSKKGESTQNGNRKTIQEENYVFVLSRYSSRP